MPTKISETIIVCKIKGRNISFRDIYLVGVYSHARGHNTGY